jgi:hypothetical protein
MSVAKFTIARLNSGAKKKKKVNHGTRYCFMAFRGSFQYSDLALVVRILKLASRTAVVYRRCGAFVSAAQRIISLSIRQRR